MADAGSDAGEAISAHSVFHALCRLGGLSRACLTKALTDSSCSLWKKRP